MATAVNFDDCKKAVVSLLQASQTAYGTSTTGNAPDGSNRQYASSTEIDDAILYADSEVCMAIINTLQHPYQTTFVTSASGFSDGSRLPARNGTIIKIMGLNGQATPIAVTDMSAIGSIIIAPSHGLTTGQLIQFTTSDVVGGGLSIDTNYYAIVIDESTIAVAVSPLAAAQDIRITLTSQKPSGTNIVLQYIEAFKARNADEVKEANQYAQVFGIDDTDNTVVPWFFIEGDVLYSTAYDNKIFYTDYTKTSSPQAPQPYRNALVAGAVSHLLKDGSDEGMMNYYTQQYQAYLQSISAGATVLAPFAAYAL